MTKGHQGVRHRLYRRAHESLIHAGQYSFDHRKKKKGDSDPGSANISKKDMEFLIAKASETAPAQTIRIESAPVKIVPNEK